MGCAVLDLALDPPEEYDECIEKMGGKEMAANFHPGPDMDCAKCLRGCEALCQGDSQEECYSCVRPGCDEPCEYLNTPDGVQGGLLHHLCKWWEYGSEVLCNRITDEVQCRRFGRLQGENNDIILDPFLNATRIRQFHQICEDDAGSDPLCMDQDTIAAYYILSPTKAAPTEHEKFEQFMEEDGDSPTVEVDGAFGKLELAPPLPAASRPAPRPADAVPCRQTRSGRSSTRTSSPRPSCSATARRPGTSPPRRSGWSGRS